MDTPETPTSPDKGSQPVVVNLLIGKVQMPLRVPADQEATFRNAAKMVNSRLSRYETRFPGLKSENYLTTVLLDMAVRTLQMAEREDTKPYTDALHQLTAEIEEVLGESNAQ